MTGAQAFAHVGFNAMSHLGEVVAAVVLSVAVLAMVRQRRRRARKLGDAPDSR